MSAGLTSASGFLALLDEPETDIKLFALQKLNQVVDIFWAEIWDKLEQIEILYEDESFAHRQLAALVASKVNFHMGAVADSMNYALFAGEHFDVNQHSEYVHTIIAMCIDTYAKHQSQIMDGQTPEAPTKGLLEVVERMFERCFAGSEFKQAAGIAMETRRLDVVERAIKTSDDPIKMLDYCFGVSMTLITNRAFRDAVLTLIARIYSEMPQPDHFKMCQCFIYLNNGPATTDVLMTLIKADREALAYQLAFDLFDSATQQFLAVVSDSLKVAAGQKAETEGGEADGESKDTAGNLEETAQKTLDNVLTILSGDLTLALSVEFLSRNNHADKLLMSNIKDAAGRGSITHNATVMANAMMYAGTTSDVFLDENKDWLRSANNWALFNAAASLGVIHQGHTAEARNVLEPYLPKDGGVGADGPHVDGGGLFALGLIYANHGAEVTDYFLQRLREPQLSEVTQHGGCLGLGLASMGSARTDVYEQMRDNHLVCESAVAGEAAGIGMGLVMLGSASESALAEMTAYARETQHEKIIRGLALGVALVMYGRQEQADKCIAELEKDKDHILRMAATHMIATAYVGTGENRIIKKLLHTAVSDVSDDVRRCAVTALGFVLCRTPEQLPSTVNLLSESFNPNVRYGTCMALGIAFSGSGNAEALSLLEPLIKDSVAFVRQGALIALAMIMMQQNAEHPKFKFTKEVFKSTMTDKHEDVLAKVGAIYGQGIMNAGGQNVTTRLVNSKGHVRMQSVVGTLVFTQFWFWFPLGNFLSIAMSPTAVICLNKNLKMPKIELKSNAPPSKFAYPPVTEPPKEKSKDKVETAVLSTTSKAKAAKNKDSNEKKEGKDGDAMEVDGAATTPAASDDAKKDKDGDTEMAADGNNNNNNNTDTKTEGKSESKTGENPTFMMLSNPARVLQEQMAVVDLVEAGGRYRPVGGSFRYVTVLEDGTPDEPEEFIEMKPVSAAGGGSGGADEAPCPEPFQFDESLEDE